MRCSGSPALQRPIPFRHQSHSVRAGPYIMEGNTKTVRRGGWQRDETSAQVRAGPFELGGSGASLRSAPPYPSPLAYCLHTWFGYLSLRLAWLRQQVNLRSRGPGIVCAVPAAAHGL